MSVKRVSDLSSILVDGTTSEGEQRVLTTEQGVVRDVLGGEESRRAGGSETNQLLNTQMEVSFPRKNEQFPTQYDSKSIKYDTLCAYITHNILYEDYSFYGSKTLNGNLSVFAEDNIYLSANTVDILAQDKINLSVVNDSQTTSYIDITNKNRVYISSDNLIMKGNNTSVVYDDSFVIYWNKEGNLIPVISCSNDGTKPTVSFPNSTNLNPVDCYIKHALWS